MQYLLNVWLLLTILTGKSLYLSESASSNGTEFCIVLEERKWNTCELKKKESVFVKINTDMFRYYCVEFT